MCCNYDDEPYVPNEYTVRIPVDAWRKLNMGVKDADSSKRPTSLGSIITKWYPSVT